MTSPGRTPHCRGAQLSHGPGGQGQFGADCAQAGRCGSRCQNRGAASRATRTTSSSDIAAAGGAGQQQSHHSTTQRRAKLRGLARRRAHHYRGRDYDRAARARQSARARSGVRTDAVVAALLSEGIRARGRARTSGRHTMAIGRIPPRQPQPQASRLWRGLPASAAVRSSQPSAGEELGERSVESSDQFAGTRLAGPGKSRCAGRPGGSDHRSATKSLPVFV